MFNFTGKSSVKPISLLQSPYIPLTEPLLILIRRITGLQKFIALGDESDHYLPKKFKSLTEVKTNLKSSVELHQITLIDSHLQKNGPIKTIILLIAKVHIQGYNRVRQNASG